MMWCWACHANIEETDTHVVGLINRGHAVADQQEIYKITRQYTVRPAVGLFPGRLEYLRASSSKTCFTDIRWSTVSGSTSRGW